MRLHYRGPGPTGLIEFDCGGVAVHNPFEVALQAMAGETAGLEYLRQEPDLVPRLFPLRFLPDPRADEHARVAMAWLCEHEVRLTDTASVWHYDFDWAFGDQHLAAPWISAFAQAYVVLACLHWFRHGGDREHLERARRAAAGLITPIAAGGCSTVVVPGTLFFEEIPGSRPTHIFNAHLASLLALCELHADTADPAFRAAIDAGVRGFEALADQFDTGSWSVYDCARTADVALQLRPDRDGPALGRVALRAGGTRRVLELGDDAVFDSGAVRAAGIDWGDVIDVGGRRHRRLRHGPSRHSEPVPTGTRQNTYLYFGTIELDGGPVELEVDLHAPDGGSVALAVRSLPDGIWRELPGRLLASPSGTVRCALPVAALRQPVSAVYHRFHVLLLQELARVSGHASFATLADRFLAHWDRYRAEALTPPPRPPRLERVYFSVNSACGLACKMCDFGIGNREASLYKALRPTDEKTVLAPDLVIRRCLEARPGLEGVHFIGTEPTFHPDLPRMVREIRAGGIRVIVTTNGLRLDRALVPLLEAGVNDLWISIDGPPPVHDEIRGYDGLFQIIAGALTRHAEPIAAAKRRGLQIAISCAISPLNHHVLADVVRSTAELPFDLYWFTHLNYITPEIAAAHSHRHPQYKIAASTVTIPEMATDRVDPFVLYRSLRAAEREVKALGRRMSAVPALDFLGVIEHYGRPERPVGRPHCHAPDSCLEVASDGSVSVMARCYQMDLGNIHRSSLHDIFTGSTLGGFRGFLAQEGLQPPCLRCCGIM
ncbi:MAG: D-glucuronyl C5-epimerase family protein [Planctomycetota bacterium]